MTVARTVDRTCALCGEAFQVSAYEVNRGRGTYCSRDCARIGNLQPVSVSRAVGLQTAPRPIPERTSLPSFWWPSERHMTPKRCGHCGATLLLGDTPTASYPSTFPTCYSCSREACELKYDGTRPRPVPAEPAVVADPCIDCGEKPRCGRSPRCSRCRSRYYRQQAKTKDRLCKTCKTFQALPHRLICHRCRYADESKGRRR